MIWSELPVNIETWLRWGCFDESRTVRERMEVLFIIDGNV